MGSMVIRRTTKIMGPGENRKYRRFIFCSLCGFPLHGERCVTNCQMRLGRKRYHLKCFDQMWY